ncbi:MAG: hypothetical protein QNJ88_00875 [Acidimicrobiia bacterium]|nr:hypothetical protein [Acidimicrobiia bacterium]
MNRSHTVAPSAGGLGTKRVCGVVGGTDVTDGSDVIAESVAGADEDGAAGVLPAQAVAIRATAIAAARHRGAVPGVRVRGIKPVRR